MSSDETASLFTRLSDVQNEPKQFLLPIQGYEVLPLVPLEQAIIPLIGIVPDIQRMAYVAKERCDDPLDHLTSDESASICLYTMEWKPKALYALLNETLREQDRQILVPWFSYLKLFLTALWKLPSVQCTLWRGVKCDLRSNYVTHKKCTWWGFSSTTTNIELLNSSVFLGQHGDRTLFNISCQNGKSIKNHSYYKKESEILLLPATQFEVVGILQQGHGLHTIELKEVQPPFPLLEPPFPQPIKVSLPEVSAVLSQTTITSTTKKTNNVAENNQNVENVPRFANSLDTVDWDLTRSEAERRTEEFMKGNFAKAFQWN